MWGVCWAAGFGLVLLALAAGLSHSREGWQDRPLVCSETELTPEELKLCRHWINNVQRPDDDGSCCGEADAFQADEFKVGPKGEYVAIITKDYPAVSTDDGEGDTIELPAIPRGTEIVIPQDKVNRAFNGDVDNPVGDKATGGNPTGHGIVFMRSDRSVICYFSPTLAGRRAPQYAGVQ